MYVSDYEIKDYENIGEPEIQVVARAVVQCNNTESSEPKKRQGNVILFYVEYDDYENHAERSPQTFHPLTQKRVGGFLVQSKL